MPLFKVIKGAHFFEQNLENFEETGRGQDGGWGLYSLYLWGLMAKQVRNYGKKDASPLYIICY